MRAGKEATEFEREYEKKVCTEDRQFLKDQGVQYYELNDEERQQLMDITRPTWDKLAVDETTKKALELIQKTQQ